MHYSSILIDYEDCSHLITIDQVELASCCSLYVQMSELCLYDAMYIYNTNRDRRFEYSNNKVALTSI